jgi:type II secretory pathway component PulF
MFRKAAPLTWVELGELSRWLSIALRSGAPWAESAAVIAQGLSHPRLKPILEDICRRVASGSTFAEAVGAHADRFPPLYAAAVRAGECAGDLAGTFDRLREHAWRLKALKGSVWYALAFPATLLVVGIAVMAAVFFEILEILPLWPSVIIGGVGGSMRGGFGAFLTVAKVLRSHYVILAACILGALAAGTFLLVSLVRGQASGYAIDWIKLHFPVLRGIFASASSERFCSALGLLLKSGVPPPESLSLAAAASGNSVLHRAADRAVQARARGAPLAEALRKTGYFDSGFCWLLDNAEQRGEVADALLALAGGGGRPFERSHVWSRPSMEPLAALMGFILIGTVAASLLVWVFKPWGG